MKLHSIQYIVSAAGRAAARFPFALVAAITAAVSAIVLVDYRGDDHDLIRLLMSAQLGIPLFVALTLLAERRGGGSSFRVRWFYQLAGLGLLIAYYFTIPENIGTLALTRFFQLNVGMHLLVAVVPYVGITDANGFWQYNKTLFLRLLAGVVFSATLFAGLSMAIAAVDQLFGADVGENIYFRLWVGVVFVFNTWYFVGGVPSDLNALTEQRDYPPIIKVFAQYILAPLVAIYLVILLVYLVKIVVTTEWPSGWIGYLVSSVAAAGLFSLVLLRPLVGQPENRWVTTYARLFYIFILPAIVMLLLAIYKRVSQYGITENRYFLTVLALWLAGVTVYGLFSRRKSIKVIPITLCLVAFLTAFGPWGAYSVSKASQTKRLETVLISNGLLADGVLTPARGDVNLSDQKQIRAGFNYLLERHGVESISSWVGDSLSVQLAELEKVDSHHSQMTREIMDSLELDYDPDGIRQEGGACRFSRSQIDETVDVSGYTVAYYLLFPSNNDNFFVDGVEYAFEHLGDAPGFKITTAGQTVAEFPLSEVLKNLKEYRSSDGDPSTVPGTLMTVDSDAGPLKARLALLELDWDEAQSDATIYYMQAIILLNTPP